MGAEIGDGGIQDGQHRGEPAGPVEHRRQPVAQIELRRGGGDGGTQRGFCLRIPGIGKREGEGGGEFRAARRQQGRGAAFGQRLRDAPFGLVQQRGGERPAGGEGSRRGGGGDRLGRFRVVPHGSNPEPGGPGMVGTGAQQGGGRGGGGRRIPGGEEQPRLGQDQFRFRRIGGAGADDEGGGGGEVPGGLLQRGEGGEHRDMRGRPRQRLGEQGAGRRLIPAQPGDGAEPEGRFGVPWHGGPRGFKGRDRLRQPAERLQRHAEVERGEPRPRCRGGAAEMRQRGFRLAGGEGGDAGAEIGAVRHLRRCRRR